MQKLVVLGLIFNILVMATINIKIVKEVEWRLNKKTEKIIFHEKKKSGRMTKLNDFFYVGRNFLGGNKKKGEFVLDNRDTT